MVENLQFELFKSQRELAKQRLEWDNNMLGMLEARKQEVSKELVRLDGQIESVKEDKVSLWEIINQTNEVPEVSENI